MSMAVSIEETTPSAAAQLGVVAQDVTNRPCLRVTVRSNSLVGPDHHVARRESLTILSLLTCTDCRRFASRQRHHSLMESLV